MSAFGLCSFLASIPLEAQEIISSRTSSFRAAFFSRRLDGIRNPKTERSYRTVFQSCCTSSPIPKESSLKLEKAELKDVGILGLEFERPYMMSFGNYMIQEAVLDEEYWAAAWLRAEIYTEGQPYLRNLYHRYIESYQKRFAEQEFTALKRRCLGKQGQSIKCICLVAVAPEASPNEFGMISQLTLRDRVIGTLDISIRQLLRGETFPKEVVTASLFTVMEPERKCGYIANVCVGRAARRQGIASSLLEVAIKAARSWKLKDLYVHVATNNVAAGRLYQKMGFQVVEDAVSELALRQEQLLCMCI